MRDLKTVLAELEDLSLVRRSQEDEPAYLFKHALTQESAYQSLLVKTRRQVHRQIAEAYESVYAERLDEFASLLSRHFSEAGVDAKTIEYATRAGDLASRVYANSEAIAHYSLAIETVEPISNDQPEQLIELYSKRGRALELAGYHVDALKTYEKLGALSHERGEPRLELASLMLRATLYNVHTPVHDSAQGAALSEQALALAQELNAHESEAKILWNLMLAAQWGQGGYARAIEFGERALLIAHRLGRKDDQAYILSDLAYSYTFAGKIAHARALREEADRLWREVGNKPMMSDNLNGLANIYQVEGDSAHALEAASEALAASDEVGNEWGQAYSQAILGLAFLELARLDDSADAFESSIRHAESAGSIGPRIVSAAGLGELYLFLGAPEAALQAAREGHATAEAHLPEWRPWTAGMLSRVYLQLGDVKRAEEAIKGLPVAADEIFERVWARGAILVALAQVELAMAQGDYERATVAAESLVRLLRDRGMRQPLPDALYLRSKALRGCGAEEEAERELAQAHDEAKAVNARRALFTILCTMAELECRNPGSGRTEGATMRARELLTEILKMTCRAKLREALLAGPAVRRIARVETLT